MLDVDKLQDRTQKFLQMAGHPSTGYYEAVNAARALRRMAEGSGITLSDLRFAPPTWPKNADPFMRDRIRTLEQEAKLAAVKMELQGRVIEILTAKLAAVEAKGAIPREASAEPAPPLQPSAETRAEPDPNTKVEPTADAGLVPLGPIVAEIVEKTGRKHITTAAAHALGIPVVEMRAWTVVKTMPATLAHKLASLSADDLKPASRKPWSDAEVGALRLMVRQGLDNLAIALALTAQFGRRIFESSIARQRSKLVMAEAWGRCGGAGSAARAAYH